jgi:hypothetical protein
LPDSQSALVRQCPFQFCQYLSSYLSEGVAPCLYESPEKHARISSYPSRNALSYSASSFSRAIAMPSANKAASACLRILIYIRIYRPQAVMGWEFVAVEYARSIPIFREGAEISARLVQSRRLWPARDPELFHARFEGGALEPQKLRRPFFATHTPAGRFQRFQDVGALGFLQGLDMR